MGILFSHRDNGGAASQGLWRGGGAWGCILWVTVVMIITWDLPGFIFPAL